MQAMPAVPANPPMLAIMDGNPNAPAAPADGDPNAPADSPSEDHEHEETDYDPYLDRVITMNESDLNDTGLDDDDVVSIASNGSDGGPLHDAVVPSEQCPPQQVSVETNSVESPSDPNPMSSSSHSPGDAAPGDTTMHQLERIALLRMGFVVGLSAFPKLGFHTMVVNKKYISVFYSNYSIGLAKSQHPQAWVGIEEGQVFCNARPRRSQGS